jgi:hypothetical protein
VYGIDLALVSNLAGNPVVNETIVKLSSEAAQVTLPPDCHRLCGAGKCRAMPS